MDRNTAIGMTLMGALLLVYFYFFSPTPQPQPSAPATTELSATGAATGDSTAVSNTTVVLDSAKVSALQGFGAFANGNEEKVKVETEDLKIEFSSKGGLILYLEMKNYQTYFGNPLV